jgi:hypothetical protein
MTRKTNTDPPGFFVYWWQQRGLWIIGDVLIICVGTATVVAALVHWV